MGVKFEKVDRSHHGDTISVFSQERNREKSVASTSNTVEISEVTPIANPLYSLGSVYGSFRELV